MNKRERAAYLEKVYQTLRERGIVVISKFPPFRAEVFEQMSAGLSPDIVATAKHIIEDHLREQARGGDVAWMGAAMPDDRAAWNANSLITAYYLRCQPDHA